MNGIEIFQTDHRILAGLIGRVWSNGSTEHDDPVARANAELYIRMYLEETMLAHRARQSTAAGPSVVEKSN